MRSTLQSSIAALVFCAAVAFAQDSRPEFDVASLKPVVLDGAHTYRSNLLSIQHGILIQLVRVRHAGPLLRDAGFTAPIFKARCPQSA
ncbi:MAG TPA: hypothetical protein VGF49_05090 [Candidatus Solibacter sp.]